MRTLYYIIFIVLFTDSLNAKDDIIYIQNQETKPGVNLGLDGTKDAPSGYSAPPVLKEILDHNITYNYIFSSCVGSLTRIKIMATVNQEKKDRLKYVFKKDRQQIYYSHATDASWPLRNMLEIKPEKNIISINSLDVYYEIGQFFNFSIEALFPDNVKKVNLVCLSLDKRDEMIYKLPVNPDNLFHNYRIHLKNRKTEDFIVGQIKLIIEYEYLETDKLIKIKEFELM